MLFQPVINILKIITEVLYSLYFFPMKPIKNGVDIDIHSSSQSRVATVQQQRDTCAEWSPTCSCRHKFR